MPTRSPHVRPSPRPRRLLRLRLVVAALLLAHRSRAQSIRSWGPDAKLVPSAAAAEDHFGAAVALDSGVAVVGAYAGDDAGQFSGAALAYERQPSGDWTESFRFAPSDGAVGDEFGCAVALSGGTALVGAKNGDGATGSNSGSVYAFDRQADGTWTQTAELAAAASASGDWFGAMSARAHFLSHFSHISLKILPFLPFLPFSLLSVSLSRFSQISHGFLTCLT